MNWETIVRKLTSRKLWMALAGFITGLMVYLGASESDAAQVSSLIMAGASVIAYCVGEGLADGSATQIPQKNAQTFTEQYVEDDDDEEEDETWPDEEDD